MSSYPAWVLFLKVTLKALFLVFIAQSSSLYSPPAVRAVWTSDLGSTPSAELTGIFSTCQSGKTSVNHLIGISCAALGPDLLQLEAPFSLRNICIPYI